MTKRLIAILRIKADGTITKTVGTKNPSYEELRAACDGIIQQVPYFRKFVHDGIHYERGTCFVNEEGILRRMPINHRLTAEWKLQFTGATLLHGNGIFYATEKATNGQD